MHAVRIHLLHRSENRRRHDHPTPASGLVLVRRAIEPGYGKWVFPGGYVDRGEPLTAAAIREAREECGLDVRLDALVNIYSYPGARRSSSSTPRPRSAARSASTRSASKAAEFEPHGDSLERARVPQHARRPARLSQRRAPLDSRTLTSASQPEWAPRAASGAILARMKHLSIAALVFVIAAAGLVRSARQRKQAPAQQQPDMCIAPPGAQPLLPAKLLPGMGTTKDFPVTTTSEEARQFFLQGVSQIHSFWFHESERSCTQALELDPNMAMAYWCIALSAASDYRPAFQLLRDPSTRGRGAVASGEAAATGASAGAESTVARTTTGAAVDPQMRAREAIAKAMALRELVTPREQLYIEAQAARRAPGNEGRGRRGLHRRAAQAGCRLSRRSRSQVDARPRDRQWIRSGDEGAARAHARSDCAARRGCRQRRWRISAPTTT